MTSHATIPSTVGLEGVVAAETRLSRVDGQAGRLIVRGHEIESLAGRLSFEAMAALLWQDLAPAPDNQPTGADAIAAALGRARVQVAERLPAILPVAAPLPPIDGLRASLAALPDDDPLGDHIVAAAAMPVLIAGLWRAGRGLAPLAPDPERGQVADFLAMLTGDEAPADIVQALETYLVVVADHGMNASTFTARVVASTRAGMIASVVAALCALKGPLHGGAPGPVLDMLDSIGGPDGIEAWLERELAGGARLMGFGHRVYRTRDPRADVLKGVVAGLSRDLGRIAFAEQVEQAAIAALAQRYPNRRLDTNVEFYTALLLDAVGLPRELFTPAFAMGRVLGWTAHAFEQVAGGRIIRPASSYIGDLPEGEAALAVAG
jgi:citrate synthase